MADGDYERRESRLSEQAHINRLVRELREKEALRKNTQAESSGSASCIRKTDTGKERRIP